MSRFVERELWRGGDALFYFHHDPTCRALLLRRNVSTPSHPVQRVHDTEIDTNLSHAAFGSTTTWCFASLVRLHEPPANSCVVHFLE